MKNQQQTPKPWWESKTIRFNASTLALLVAVLGYLISPESPITIGPELTAAIVALIAVLSSNIFLRSITDSPITKKIK